MSKKTINHIFNEAGETAALSLSEKEALRERIREYVAFNPIRKPSESTHAKRGIFEQLTFRYVPALIIAGLVFSGAGVSYAAEDALPGDLLYSVKLNINEEIISALTADPTSRAIWEAARAERRLAEVRSLAKAGLLNTETISIAADSFTEQANRAVENVTALSKNDPAAAAEVTAELESALETHEMILASLSVEEGAGSDVLDIAAKARAEAKRITSLREEVESAIVPENVIAIATDMAMSMMSSSSSEATTTQTEGADDVPDAASVRVAERMRAASERALAQFRDDATEHSNDEEVTWLDTALTAELSSGTEALEKGAIRDAYAHFRTVLTRSTRAIRVLRAEAELNIALPLSEEFTPGTSVSEEPSEIEKSSPTINLEAPSIEEAANAKASAEAALQALEDLEEITKGPDSGQLRRELREARAYIVRGDIAIDDGDGIDALRLYERAIEKATQIIKAEDITSTTTDAFLAREGSLLIAGTVHHRYAEGVHVFEGLVRTPDPCHQAVASVHMPTSGEMTLVIRWERIGGMCIQTTAEKQFAASISAPEDAILKSVYVDTDPIEGFRVLEAVETDFVSTSTLSGTTSMTDTLMKRATEMLDSFTPGS